MRKLTLPAPRAPRSPGERDRLLRPATPPRVPPRTPAPPAADPGNLAYQLLGARVVK